jgi:PIN domain nuclease of toxin-antitoxin system
MNLLLDTHAYLWFIGGSEKLAAQVRRAIESPSNRVFVSSISLWEITIKFGLGKLSLLAGLEPVLNEHIRNNGFDILNIESPHLLELSNLPMHHRDPFDRLLVAQCIAERMTLCSADSVFGAYDVELMWS